MDMVSNFVPGPISDSHRYEPQNFLKYDSQIQHYAFLYIIFKNSYLPVYQAKFRNYFFIL